MTKEFFDRGKQIAKWADNNMTKDDLVSKDTALKMAIEALQNIDNWLLAIGQRGLRDYEYDALQACKEALEQPAQEPVAWTDKHNLFLEFDKEWLCNKAVCKDNEAIPLYTQPAPSWQGNKEFVGLSDDEIQEELKKMWDKGVIPSYSIVAFARAIEQELKTKNGFSVLKEKNNAVQSKL